MVAAGDVLAIIESMKIGDQRAVARDRPDFVGARQARADAARGDNAFRSRWSLACSADRDRLAPHRETLEIANGS